MNILFKLFKINKIDIIITITPIIRATAILLLAISLTSSIFFVKKLNNLNEIVITIAEVVIPTKINKTKYFRNSKNKSVFDVVELLIKSIIFMAGSKAVETIIPTENKTAEIYTAKATLSLSL